MSTRETIAHTGFVTGIKNGRATVHLFQDAECHSCRMKDFCGVTDEERNTFIISGRSLKIGDNVQVAIKPSTGFLAMFWAYFFPFLLVFSIIILGNAGGWNEGISGILALVSLLPYYLILALVRRFFRQSIQLDIKKL